MSHPVEETLGALTRLTRVAVPFFSFASRACQAAAVLMSAYPAITATGAAGFGGQGARTATAALSPNTGQRARGPGPSRCRRRCEPRGGAHFRAIRYSPLRLQLPSALAPFHRPRAFPCRPPTASRLTSPGRTLSQG